MDGRAPAEKRQPKLSSTQVFPYVGNSTVKRIIAGVIPSVAAYDPFAQVEESKLQSLEDFIEPVGYVIPSLFYHAHSLLTFFVFNINSN